MYNTYVSIGDALLHMTRLEKQKIKLKQTSVAILKPERSKRCVTMNDFSFNNLIAIGMYIREHSSLSSTLFTKALIKMTVKACT